MDGRREENSKGVREQQIEEDGGQGTRDAMMAGGSEGTRDAVMEGGNYR